MTAADWREAEAMAMRGTTLAEIARRFGIRHATVRQRASRCDWQTPDRIARKQRMAARLAKQGLIPAAPQTVTEAPERPAEGEGLGPFAAELQAAAEGEPREFRDMLKRLARAAIAEGAAKLPAPRTLNDLRTLVDVLAKVENMDAKAPQQGVPRLHAPRSIGRVALRTVEAEVVKAEPAEFEIE